MGTLKATTVVTEPTQEPLSLHEVKEHLRVETNDDDSYLESLIQEARVYVERNTGRALITQTRNYKLDKFYQELTIPTPPLQSIESISYQDADNATQTLSSVYYDVDTDSEPGRLFESYDYEYPDTYDTLNAVTIQYKAGYGDDPEDVPERFKMAMKLRIQYMYDGEKNARDALESIITQDRIEWL